ncbi:MAG: GGDEF domain-containing protein [Armatimonadetes bacterium]|nr:GGDEF domain-containing protein [Armatimonadota bacterium]
MILDVDFFKKINDHHGHPQGDALLRQLGGILRESTGAHDVLCRYGGDEFTVTMPGTNRIGALVIAERIREGIEQYEFVLGGQIVHVTVSGGVASFPEDADTSKELVERADQAMFQAKQRGRNKVCFDGG